MFIAFLIVCLHVAWNPNISNIHIWYLWSINNYIAYSYYFSSKPCLYYCVDAPHRRKRMARIKNKKLYRNYSTMRCTLLNKSWKQTSIVRPLTSCLKNHPGTTNKICETMLEKQGITHKRRSPRDFCPRIRQCWPTCKDSEISYTRTLNVVLRTFQKWWMIGTNGETKSTKPVLSARFDDNNNEDDLNIK